MSCRRVKNQLSPYLDERLTGREMLEIREHLDHCDSCHNEYLSLRQIKILLRTLPLKDPGYTLEQKIFIDVTNERYGILSLPLFSSPKRSRRIAVALVFSCLSILSVSIQIGSGELEAYHPSTIQQVHEALVVNMHIFNSTHNTAGLFPDNGKYSMQDAAISNRQPLRIAVPGYPSNSNNDRPYPMFSNSSSIQSNYISFVSSH